MITHKSLHVPSLDANYKGTVRTCFQVLVLATIAVLGTTTEAAITTVGDVSPTYPSEAPEPPDPWNVSVLKVGQLGIGELSIDSGSDVIVGGGNGSIGATLGSVGRAVVMGPGSSWINYNRLYIGEYGKGTLEISAAGHVSNFERGIIGYGPLSEGTATVTGTGTYPENLTIWESHELIVGWQGMGALNVNSAGQVYSGGELENGSINFAFLGVEPDSKGMVIVKDPHSLWYHDGDILLQRNSSLTIGNGGVVQNTGYGHIWDDSEVIVEDADSTWDIAQSLHLFDKGTLTIEDGGRVSSSAGQLDNTTAVIVKGPDSMWDTSSLFLFEHSSIKLQDGGKISTTFDNLGALTMHDDSTFTVEGPKSEWSGKDIYLEENASLEIKDGGRVAVSGELYITDNSSLTVSGTDSHCGSDDSSCWGLDILPYNPLHVYVNSTLSIKDGGRVRTSGVYAGLDSPGNISVMVQARNGPLVMACF